MVLTGTSSPKYWIGSSSKTWGEASRQQVYEAMDVDALFADPQKKMQFMDLHYDERCSAENLNVLLAGKGRLDGSGEIFLKAAKNE
jgi:bifunctional autolysin